MRWASSVAGYFRTFSRFLLIDLINGVYSVNYVVIISVFVLLLLDLPEPTICLEIDGECLTSTIRRENQTTVDRVFCSVNGEY